MTYFLITTILIFFCISLISFVVLRYQEHEHQFKAEEYEKTLEAYKTNNQKNYEDLFKQEQASQRAIAKLVRIYLDLANVMKINVKGDIMAPEIEEKK